MHRINILFGLALALISLTGSAADLPLERIKLPPGFAIELWARVDNARQMTLGRHDSHGGTLFVGSMQAGKVHAVSFGADLKAQAVKLLASGLRLPVGVAYREGSLYVSAVNRILRYDDIERRLENPPAAVLLTDKLPGETHHGWKFIAFGPDGKLYVPVGAPCNICEPDKQRYANIMRMNADGSAIEVYALGVRNSVGLTHNPATRELWATNNGRDWAGNESPQDSLHRVRRSGEDHGFPYCVGAWADPQENAGRSCSEFTQPAALLGAHTAPLGLRFYTGTMFPEAYRNQIFIARRGSWNRERLSGYDVVVAKLDAQGNVTGVEPFMEGLRDDANQRFLGRPVDVHVMRDGALLVSDEQMGAIYRISYRQ